MYRRPTTDLLNDTVTFQEFALLTQGQVHGSGDPSHPMGRLSLDTRTLQVSEVFLALKGTRFDGHDFVEAACRRGAQGLIVERLPAMSVLQGYRGVVVRVPDTLDALQTLARAIRGRSHATVIGISGSNGKTTAKEMLAAILTPLFPTLVTKGNQNNQIGVPLTLLELTPDHHLAVLEIGISTLEEMRRLLRLAAPSIGMLTNIGKAHLAGLGTLAGVFAAKRMLLDALPATGCAIVNLDDPWLAPLASQLPCRIVTFGETPGAQVQGSEVQEDRDAIDFTLRLEGTSARVKLPVLGRFNISNALAAAAAARAVGATHQQIVEGLQRFTPTAMRMERVVIPGGTILINDAYNANPTSMRSAIEGFCQAYPDRKRYLVLGDMLELGSASKHEHRMLGAWLAGLPIAGLFLIGPEAKTIAQGAREAGLPAERAVSEDDFERLENLIRPHLAPDAAFLFKASRAVRLEAVVHQLCSITSRC
ncbi:MAG: UDP-N-acetylmuramoyl-tripeptide--D-alanyl-D-alanine ligase [Elusimicrobia bacterium]|nr:UDP-N-acetylmuramoyl-tripeptide--D-alanyl-D-alanine ligase [Elusimicrobiota bacterium]